VAALVLACAAPLWGAQTPALLVHGLWGGAGSWGAYAQHLTGSGYEEGCLLEFASGSTRVEPEGPKPGPGPGENLTGSVAWSDACASGKLPARSVFRVVFRDNDGESFETQGRQLAAAIDWVRQHTGASQVSLVGHSMGGLAIRAYLQSPGYRGDVAAVATVATPHLGSLLPYLSRERAGALCSNLAKWLAGKDLAALAVRSLAPDSDELVALDTARSPFGPLPGGPRWLNVVAQFQASGIPNCIFNADSYLSAWQRDLALHFDAARARSLASGGLMANWTDGVVPVVSQLVRAAPVGARLEVATEVVDGFHSDVTESPATWKALDAFLAGSSPDAAAGSCVAAAQALSRGEAIQFEDLGGRRDRLVPGGNPMQDAGGSVEIEHLDWLDGFAPGRPLLAVRVIRYRGASSGDRESYLFDCGSSAVPRQLWKGESALEVENGRLTSRTVHWTEHDAHCCPSLLVTRVLTFLDGRIVESDPLPSFGGHDPAVPASGDGGVLAFRGLLEGAWESRFKDERELVRIYADGSYASITLSERSRKGAWCVGRWLVPATLVPGLRDLNLTSEASDPEATCSPSWTFQVKNGKADVYQVLDGEGGPGEPIITLRRVGPAPALGDLVPPSPGLAYRPAVAAPESRRAASAAAVTGGSRVSADPIPNPLPSEDETTLDASVLGSVVRREGSVLTLRLDAGKRLRPGDLVLVERGGAVVGRGQVMSVLGKDAELELQEESGIWGPRPGDLVRKEAR